MQVFKELANRLRVSYKDKAGKV